MEQDAKILRQYHHVTNLYDRWFYIWVGAMIVLNLTGAALPRGMSRQVIILWCVSITTFMCACGQIKNYAKKWRLRLDLASVNDEPVRWYTPFTLAPMEAKDARLAVLRAFPVTVLFALALVGALLAHQA